MLHVQLGEYKIFCSALRVFPLSVSSITLWGESEKKRQGKKMKAELKQYGPAPTEKKKYVRKKEILVTVGDLDDICLIYEEFKKGDKL